MVGYPWGISLQVGGIRLGDITVINLDTGLLVNRPLRWLRKMDVVPIPVLPVGFRIIVLKILSDLKKPDPCPLWDFISPFEKTPDEDLLVLGLA